MTEWDASDYVRISGLQQAMAEEVLALLQLQGSEQVLDVGCGNGKITAEIANRVPRGLVVGVDPSTAMIEFAATHFGSAMRPNLRFLVGDARRLPFHERFDLVVSFNALHWIPEQDEALLSLRETMKASARAQLRLVTAGARKSLENVIEETRRLPQWQAYFHGFQDPYLHLTPEQYAALAEQSGFVVRHLRVENKEWDFGSRPTFVAFGSVTFVAWTQRLPESKRLDFVVDVLNQYQRVAVERSGEENTFKFCQMDIALDA